MSKSRITIKVSVLIVFIALLMYSCTVAAGKKFKGIVGYEVPSDWQEFEIVFTPDFWSGKGITFTAVKDTE